MILKNKITQEAGRGGFSRSRGLQRDRNEDSHLHRHGLYRKVLNLNLGP
jgi:hypothetical protein